MSRVKIIFKKGKWEMEQELIVMDQVSDKTKVQVMQLRIKELEQQVAELTELVEESKILHFKDNFKVVRKAKENEEIVHFNRDGRQLPF